MTKSRNYPLLLASQFLSAFGDNVILAIIVGQLGLQQKHGQISEDLARTLNAVYTGLLFIPYIFFAPLAGYVNDRFPKSRWLLGGNAIKLGGCALAGTSVWYGAYWQGIGYFVVGIGACLYSPAKYGILPEILPKDRLVKANGTVELLTLIAILIGPFVGARLIDTMPVPVCYAVTFAIFAGSLSLNFFMTRTPEHREVTLRASYPEFFANFKVMLSSGRLARILSGTVLFWSCGAVLKMNFLPWGLQVLGLEDNTQVALFGLCMGLGVMVGSMLAGHLHKVGDLGRTRIYGMIMAGLVLLLGLIHHLSLVLVVLEVVGVSAGLFLVPLNAALQAECHQDKLGKAIATQNFVENIAMIMGALYVLGAIQVKLSASGVYVGLGALVALIAYQLKFSPRTEGKVP